MMKRIAINEKNPPSGALIALCWGNPHRAEGPTLVSGFFRAKLLENAINVNAAKR